MTRIVITLTVNTQLINQQNVLQEVSLSDGSGSSGANPEDFTTELAINDEAFWTGRAEDRSTGDTVTIDKITYESGTNILGETELSGDAQGDVLGVAVHGNVDDEQKYGIYFTVTKGSNPPTQYFLDPKLKLHDQFLGGVIII